MKKSILIFCTALSTLAYSQTSILVSNYGTSLALAPNATINVSTTAGVTAKVDLDIKNTSGSTKSYLAKRYNVILNTGASAYFCFAGGCYGDQTALSPNSLTLTAGQSASNVSGTFNILTADLDEGPVAGNSIVKYTFFNESIPSDSVQVSIVYNPAPPVGLKETTKSISSFEIFPNPAKEMASLKVNSLVSSQASVFIYNALGNVVYHKEVLMNEGKNKIDLSVEDLSPGIYFACLKSGGTSQSKKLIIN
jgi:hypothetical protein